MVAYSRSRSWSDLGPIGLIVAIEPRGLGSAVGVVSVMHLWAGGARRMELKAVHLWVSCRL